MPGKMTATRKKTALALLALAVLGTAALALLHGAGPGEDAAGEEAIPGESLAQVTALGGGAGLDSSGGVLLGIDIRLHEGWKTYWRLPWESGLPPLLDWSGSRNLESAQALWPAPLRFEDAGGAYFGYRDRLLLPVAVRAADGERPLQAELLLRYAVCRHVCIPLQERLAWRIEPGGDGAAAAPLLQALERVPKEEAPAARFLDARLVGEGGATPELQVRLLLSEPPGESDSFLLVEEPAPRLFGRERLLESRAEGAGVEVRFALAVLDAAAAAALRADGARLLFRNGETAVSALVPVR